MLAILCKAEPAHGRNPNRWLIAAAAAAVMLTIGTIYSWAIFTQPLLVAYQWNLTVTTWAYAISNFSLAEADSGPIPVRNCLKP